MGPAEKAVNKETIVDALWSRSDIVRAMSMKPAAKSKETQTVVWMCETVSHHTHPLPPLPSPSLSPPDFAISH